MSRSGEEIVRDLCSYETERSWFELKENWFNADELGEYISAIANCSAYEGRTEGYFLWGVDDETHELVGTTFDFHKNIKGEPLEHYLTRNLHPSVNFRFEELEIDGKYLVLLTIPSAKVIPVDYNRERFIRIGSSKVNIRKYPDKEASLFSVLIMGPPTLTNTRSDYQDLTFNQLETYYKVKSVPWNPVAFKRNLGFYTKDGEYNLLSQLLSDDCHMPVRIAKFTGVTKASPLYQVQEFGFKCLLNILDDVLRFGAMLNTPQADERNRLVERKEIPLFNFDAYREAVINAFVHNKWVSGNSPAISVFSDRLEILSYGPLPDGQTIANCFDGVSVPVNEKLTEIFLQLHISEKSGRGVPKIVNCYGKGAFTFDENIIRVTIPFQLVQTNLDTDQHSASNAKDRPVLNATGQKVLALIEENPNITRQQLADRLHLSRSMIAKVINVLKVNGYIERIGSARSGYWHIL